MHFLFLYMLSSCIFYIGTLLNLIFMDDKTAQTNSGQAQVKVEEFSRKLEEFDPASLIKGDVDTGKVRNVVMQNIVDLIKEKVSHDEMNDERAKKIADLVLQKLPTNISYEHLMKVIPTLDDQFRELGEVVVPIMVEYEKKIKEEVGKLVSKLIKEGKLDEARKVIQTTLEFEKGLV